MLKCFTAVIDKVSCKRSNLCLHRKECETRKIIYASTFFVKMYANALKEILEKHCVSMPFLIWRKLEDENLCYSP